jgi:hypothetical protein
LGLSADTPPGSRVVSAWQRIATPKIFPDKEEKRPNMERKRKYRTKSSNIEGDEHEGACGSLSGRMSETQEKGGKQGYGTYIYEDNENNAQCDHFHHHH